MAFVAITLRVMPTSPSVDMVKLKENVQKRVNEIGGNFHSAKEEPIAFGLNALVCLITWNESKDPDVIETEIAKVPDVNSVQITDVRRMLG